jgi:hypothetical protein
MPDFEEASAGESPAPAADNDLDFSMFDSPPVTSQEREPLSFDEPAPSANSADDEETQMFVSDAAPPSAESKIDDSAAEAKEDDKPAEGNQGDDELDSFFRELGMK